VKTQLFFPQAITAIQQGSAERVGLATTELGQVKIPRAAKPTPESSIPINQNDQEKLVRSM
jgi:hypothetical protein